MIDGMKALIIGLFWLPAAWVAYDLLAWFLGLPRSVTPLVAGAMAIGAWALVARTSAVRRNRTLATRAQEIGSGAVRA